MKALIQYLRGYVKESIAGPFFKLLEATFELLVPLVMTAIIDKGIPGGDKGYIVRMGLLMIAFGVVGFACTLLAQYFSAKAAVGFSSKLRQATFDHIQDFSFTDMDDLGASTLITRLTGDINQIQSGLNLTLRLFLRSPFIVFGAMVMAFTIDTAGALVFAMTIPLLSVVVFGVMLLTMPLYKKVQAKLDGVLRITRENLTGARVIRAFNKQEGEQQHFAAEHSELTRLQLFAGKLSALMNPLTYTIINAATLVLIWIGAIRVGDGRLTQGEVVALVNYMSQILVELVKLANLIITMTKSMACANRVAAVLAVQPGMPDGTALSLEEAGQYAVEFEDVSLTYEGAGAESLEHISFRVPAGQTVGVIGGTGSGKSSLVNLIPRFYDATSGCVKVNGADVRAYPKARLRSKIGAVLQKTVLFSGTIRENLLWGDPDATEEQLWQALEAAQAAEFVREKGLDAPVAQGAANLSGGQRQRLAIARALVRDPEILILDDSASALDYATDAKLRKALRALPGKHTVFIVSQRTSSIRHADQIIVLEDGAVADIGTHDALLERCEVYQEIYYSQFPKEEA